MREQLTAPLALFLSMLCALTGFFALVFGYWGVLFYQHRDEGWGDLFDDYLAAMGIVFGILAFFWIVFLKIRPRENTPP